jgi:hypothetical protein
LYNASVIRFLAFAGAVALTFSQPAIVLAEPAPPGGVAMPMPAAPMPMSMPIYAPPVYHMAPPAVYHPAPRPAPAARPVMSNPDAFKVPFDVPVHPGPLHGTIARPPFEPALQPNPLLIPSRLHPWQGFFWPTNYVNAPGPSCYMPSGYWGPWGMLAAPAVSLGSSTYTAPSQQVDPAYGVDIGTLGGVYQQYATPQAPCSGFVGL